MRLLVTADLHYNHLNSKAPAREVIARMNGAGGDGVLVIGDTAASDGPELEQCLSLFTIGGPRLFVAGNHELWTMGPDSAVIFSDNLPNRVRAMGWRWLQNEPFLAENAAVVGSLGWYDYSFAQRSLGIPDRFYGLKISPGAAERFDELGHLFSTRQDIEPQAMGIVARWNDGRYVHLGKSDAEFLDEQLATLEGQLEGLRHVARVVAAIHHLPFRELLPPSHSGQWDFAKAYLGSEKIGELLLRYPNVTEVYCGHSHFAAEARVGPIRAVNIGAGYRNKAFVAVEL